MAVHDRLSCRGAAVHANVEPFDGLVSSKDVCSDLIEKQTDRAPLRLVEVEIRRRVSAGDDQRMQRRNRVGVIERDSKLILGDNRAVGRETEEALGHSVGHALTNSTQVTVVPRTLVDVALVTERLKIRDVVRTPMPSWQDVINLKPPFVC